VDASIDQVDVEGFELRALRSAFPLLTPNASAPPNVDNIVVEFGPPSRWASGTAFMMP
jgi:hypothetical protein